MIISFINSPTETRVKYFLQRPSSKHKHCSEFSHLKGRRQFSSWSQLLPCVLQRKTFWGAVIHCRVFKHRPFLTSFQPCLKSEFFSFTTFSLKSVTVQTTRNRKCKWLERSTRENSDLRMNCVCEVGVNLHSKVSKRLCCWKNEGGVGKEGSGEGLVVSAFFFQTRGKNSDSNLHQLYWWIKRFDSVDLLLNIVEKKPLKCYYRLIILLGWCNIIISRNNAHAYSKSSHNCGGLVSYI